MKHQMNKLGVFSRWFTEADIKYFKSAALRTVTNKARSMPAMVNQKKKKILGRCISKILFIDTEYSPKIWISWQVFFKDFLVSFGTTYFNNGFLSRYFSQILMIEFRIATYSKTGLSQKYSSMLLFVDLFIQRYTNKKH